LVASGDPEIQRAVVRAAVQLRTKEASTPLFDLLKSPSTASGVRAVLVPALVALNAAQASEAVRLALSDPDPGVQASAIPYLGRLDGDQSVVLLAGFVRAGTNTSGREAAQAAYAALAQLARPEADALVLAGLDDLVADRLPSGLQLDVLMAAEARAASSQGIRDRLAEYLAKRRSDDVLAPFREAITGGSVARGRAIFVDHPNAQCLRCHTVARNGGTVGPVLDGIGKSKTPEELLESIVFPNRSYAVGFAPAPGAKSAMPDGLADSLTRQELRDLVAFLASLK
jgi:mono/diheme cytochrome c family protein